MATVLLGLTLAGAQTVLAADGGALREAGVAALLGDSLALRPSSIEAAIVIVACALWLPAPSVWRRAPDARAPGRWRRWALAILVAPLLLVIGGSALSATGAPIRRELVCLPLLWLAVRLSPMKAQSGVAVIGAAVGVWLTHHAVDLEPQALVDDAVALGCACAVFLAGCRCGALYVRRVTARDRPRPDVLGPAQWDLRHPATAPPAAEETVRRATARDLHDGIGQFLAGQAITLAVLRQRCEDPTQMRLIDQIDEARQEAQHAVREMIRDLNRPDLDQATLRHMLSFLEDDFARRHDFTVAWRVEADPSLPPATMGFVYRCVRELLYNVLKHAQQSRAEVVVGAEGDCLVVTVTDRGVGFDPRQPVTDGAGSFGLIHLRRLMVEHDASLSVISEPGQGCRAEIRLPLPVHAAGENAGL